MLFDNIGGHFDFLDSEEEGIRRGGGDHVQNFAAADGLAFAGHDLGNAFDCDGVLEDLDVTESIVGAGKKRNVEEIDTPVGGFDVSNGLAGISQLLVIHLICIHFGERGTAGENNCRKCCKHENNALFHCSISLYNKDSGFNYRIAGLLDDRTGGCCLAILEEETLAAALGYQINDAFAAHFFSFAGDHVGKSCCVDGVFQQSRHADLAGRTGNKRDPQKIETMSCCTDVCNRSPGCRYIHAVEIVLVSGLQSRATGEHDSCQGRNPKCQKFFVHFNPLSFRTFVLGYRQTHSAFSFKCNSDFSKIKYFFQKKGKNRKYFRYLFKIENRRIPIL